MIEWTAATSRAATAIVISACTRTTTAAPAPPRPNSALMAGADRVEGCLFGNGERTGNVDIVNIALNLYTQGVDPGSTSPTSTRSAASSSTATSCRCIRAIRTSATSSSRRSPARTRTRSRRVSPRAANGDIWEMPYLPIDPKDLGRSYEAVIRVNSQSGKGGIAYLLESEYGLELPRRLQIEFSAVIAVQCPRKFTANCSSRSSSLVVSSGPGCWIAAPLLKAPSSRPCSRSTRSNRSTDPSTVSEVQGNGVGHTAIGAHLRDDLVKGLGAAGREHDRGTLLCEEPSRGRPDATARAGDEHNLAAEQSDGCSIDVVRHDASVRPTGRPEAGTDRTRINRRTACRLGSMDKTELGAFLRSRRERLRPQDVGLPSGARRRTPGLRREEVAVLAHISTEYYVRLEQGRAPRPSGEVLAGIAGALRLTDLESDHLHVLAAPRRSEPGCTDATCARASSRSSNGCPRRPRS
jgi:transcriptional regulator with XRE-family HTH domain